MAIIEFGVLLPFFLVLALVYGALEVSGTFKNRGVKGLIAVVLAFFAITSAEVVAFLFFIMPYAAIFFVAFFLLSFILSVFKGKDGTERNYPLIIVVLALILIFLTTRENLSVVSLDDQNFVGMIVLLVIALILYGTMKIKS